MIYHAVHWHAKHAKLTKHACMQCITLHRITSHHITLHYIMYIALHCITVHYIAVPEAGETKASRFCFFAINLWPIPRIVFTTCPLLWFLSWEMFITNLWWSYLAIWKKWKSTLSSPIGQSPPKYCPGGLSVTDDCVVTFQKALPQNTSSAPTSFENVLFDQQTFRYTKSKHTRFLRGAPELK